MPQLNIIVAMTCEHAQRTLTPSVRQRLERCGKVGYLASATDYKAPESREALARAEVLLTGTGTAMLDEDDLNLAPKLQAIIHAAGTLRPIVTESAYDRGIRLSSQAATNALPVAEYTVAMILLELKGVPVAEHLYRRHRHAIDVDAILGQYGNYRRRIGIISASNIGRRVIELLRPFDLEIVVFDPYLDEEEAVALGVSKTDLRELLSTSDLVSIHTPLLPETRGMIGGKELQFLRDGTVLVNTSRGAVIDQGALIAELLTHRIRAVLDVTDPELPDPESPLWNMENLVLTPHVAGSRGLELHRIGERAVDEVERLSRSENLLYEVTPERYRTNA